MQKIIDLKCPGCGASIDTSKKYCDYCGRKIIVSTFNDIVELSNLEINKYTSTYNGVLKDNPSDVNIVNSIAMCYLKLKMYDKALLEFEKIMDENFDNSEIYFLASIAILKGRKPYLATLKEVKKAIEYINSAIMIEHRGIYNYLLAYIKYDYFYRKGFDTNPDYKDELKEAKNNLVTLEDIEFMFNIMNQNIPSKIKLY